MTLRPVRPFVALAAALAIAFMGMPSIPVAAASSSDRGAPQWVIRKDGKVINQDHVRSLGIDYEKLQKSLDEYSRNRHANPKRIERLQLLLDFAAATTKQERAALLKKMGVTMVVTAPADGGIGRMLNFVVRGQVRRQMYLAPQPQQPELETPSGPSESSGDFLGRWKDDGNGGCYWDPNDDGPDQCEPSGGGGMVCYHEGQPSECATDEEIAEMLALAAASEDEVAGYEADYYQAEAELNQYCSQNPWDCQDLNFAEATVGGPSDCGDAEAAFGACVDQAVNAVQSLGAHALAILGMEGAMADAAAAASKLSKQTRWSLQGTFLLTAFTAGYAVGSYVACKVSRVKAPEVESLRVLAAESAAPFDRWRHATIAVGNQ